MTESQQAAYARAGLMLTEALNSDWWRQPPERPDTYYPPWPGRDEVGFIIPGVAGLPGPVPERRRGRRGAGAGPSTRPMTASS